MPTRGWHTGAGHGEALQPHPCLSLVPMCSLPSPSPGSTQVCPTPRQLAPLTQQLPASSVSPAHLADAAGALELPPGWHKQARGQSPGGGSKGPSWKSGHVPWFFHKFMPPLMFLSLFPLRIRCPLSTYYAVPGTPLPLPAGKWTPQHLPCSPTSISPDAFLGVGAQMP